MTAGGWALMVGIERNLSTVSLTLSRTQLNPLSVDVLDKLLLTKAELESHYLSLTFDAAVVIFNRSFHYA